jgi:hypothetical protein
VRGYLMKCRLEKKKKKKRKSFPEKENKYNDMISAQSLRKKPKN